MDNSNPKCSSCQIVLDHLRDGTTEEGHRCNNCYWEEEKRTDRDWRSFMIYPDYRKFNKSIKK